MNAEHTVRQKLVKCMEANKRTEPNEYAFRLPCRVLVAGGSGSGKSLFLTTYMLTKGYGRSQFDHIVIMCPPSSAEQPAFQQIKAVWKQYLTIVTDFDYGKVLTMLKGFHEEGYQTALVLDDLQEQLRKGAGHQFANEMAVHGRHLGVSTFYLQQQIFTGNRTQRLQIDYYILFKFQGARSEVESLVRQLTTDKTMRTLFLQAYKTITETNGHAYMMVDLKSDTKEGLRVREDSLRRVIPELASL
jgi:hypothetical protein